jgi:Helix-turn-helix domain
MPGVDGIRGRWERDKLTIAEVCAVLGISHRTLYEWRAKRRAPRMHHAAGRQPPRSPFRIPAVAACPLARQAMTTDTSGQTYISFYGKAARFLPEKEAIIPPAEFWT